MQCGHVNSLASPLFGRRAPAAGQVGISAGTWLRAPVVVPGGHDLSVPDLEPVTADTDR